MIFISLARIREKPTKETASEATNITDEFKKRGIRILNWYWTLGRYDTVVIFEAANEKEALKMQIDISDIVSTETLVAIPRQEAIQLL